MKHDASGTRLWKLMFGGDLLEEDYNSSSVAVDESGNVVIAGGIDGEFNFGGGSLTGRCYLAKLDPDGAHLWSMSFEGPCRVDSLEVDAAGEILLAGEHFGSLDLGDGPLESPGVSSGFVARLSSEGDHLWSVSFGGSATKTGVKAALNSLGNIVVVGQAWQGIVLGGSELPAIDERGIFVAVYSPAGEHLWSKGFTGSGSIRVNSFDVNHSDDLVVTGLFCGEVDFGGGSLNGAEDANMFVALLDSAGSHRWSMTFDGADGRNVVVDGSGNVLLSGVLAGDYGWADIEGCEG